MVSNVNDIKSAGDGYKFGFNDNEDDCDCNAIRITDVCGKNDSSSGSPEGVYP